METTNPLGQSPRVSGRYGRLKWLIASLLLYVILVSGGLGIASFHSDSLPPALREAIDSHNSILRAAVAGGLAGLMGLVILGKKVRSNRKPAIPVAVRSNPVMFENRPANLHPLFWTPRPARDETFVFRKTKKKGKLHRNRMGEKATKPDES